MAVIYNCETCTVDISEKEEEEEEAFKCDFCASWYHFKCDKMTKKDIKARNGGNRLKLFCSGCEKSQDNSIMNTLLELRNVVYKIDLALQERKPVDQSNDNLLAAMAKRVEFIERKMVDMNIDVNLPGSSAEPKQSFANVVKSDKIKPAVVIKPKSRQNSKKTMDDISNKIDKSQVSVCDTRNIREGGVVLRCNNKNDTMKVKEMVRESLGDEYEVILPAIKNPRVRITNVCTNIPDEQIVNELKANNEQIQSIDMKLVTCIPKRKRGATSNDVIFEVDADAYSKLLHIGTLNLPWRECRIYEHIHLKRCFKCCGYSHISSQCNREQFCSKCAGKHKQAECRNNRTCCINCKSLNERYNLKLDTNHHAWSHNCDVYQRRIQNMRSKIEFNASE